MPFNDTNGSTQLECKHLPIFSVLCQYALLQCHWTVRVSVIPYTFKYILYLQGFTGPQSDVCNKCDEYPMSRTVVWTGKWLQVCCFTAETGKIKLYPDNSCGCRIQTKSLDMKDCRPLLVKKEHSQIALTDLVITILDNYSLPGYWLIVVQKQLNTLWRGMEEW